MFINRHFKLLFTLQFCLLLTGMGLTQSSKQIDTLSYVNPGRRESCNNGKDDNCNGEVDETPLINYVSNVEVGGQQFSLGSLEACDHITVASGTTWEVKQPRIPLGGSWLSLSAEKLIVEEGATLLLGGSGCQVVPLSGLLCEGDQLDINSVEIKAGAEVEIGPYTLVRGGCLFCLGF